MLYNKCYIAYMLYNTREMLHTIIYNVLMLSNLNLWLYNWLCSLLYISFLKYYSYHVMCNIVHNCVGVSKGYIAMLAHVVVINNMLCILIFQFNVFKAYILTMYCIQCVLYLIITWYITLYITRYICHSKSYIDLFWKYMTCYITYFASWVCLGLELGVCLLRVYFKWPASAKLKKIWAMIKLYLLFHQRGQEGRYGPKVCDVTHFCTMG